MPRIGKSIEEILISRSAENKLQTSSLTASTGDSHGREMNDMSRQSRRQGIGGRSTLSASASSLRSQGSGGLITGNISSIPKAIRRNDNEKMTIESLMEHSHALQLHVKDLQTKLIKSENLVENLQHELASRRGRSNSLIAGARILSAPSPRGALAGPGIGSSTLSIAVPPRPKSNYEKSPLKSIQKSPKLSQGHAFTSSTPSRRSSSAPLSPTGGGGGAGAGHDGASDLMKFTSTIDHMDKQLAELKYLFRPMDPLLERSHSVIKIQAVVRRWIAQRKYQKYWMSLSSWCLGRAQTYLPVIEQGLYRSSRINSTIQSIHIKKSSILLKSIFDRWIHICKQSAPFRRSMIVAAEERYRAKIFRFKLEYFLAFKNGTLGTDSHKQLRKEHRLLVERIRHDLQLKNQQIRESSGGIGLLVSDEEIKRAVYREIVTQSNSKRRQRNIRIVFETFRSLYTLAKKYRRIALQHQFTNYAGRCFYAWSDWTYQVGSGLERKRWAGPRKYEVRYNQKLVEHFSKIRLKKMTFNPWKLFAKRSKRVNYLFIKKLSDFLRANLCGWRQVATKNKRLRQETISNWAGYAVLVMSTPFAAWKEYASTASIRRMHQNSLVTAYTRWKQRQKHIHILRLWRHQSLYGGIEGMYSRTTISKSLGEQKGMTAALQKMLTKQTIELEECKELVHKETTTRKKMEDKVAEKDAEIEKLKIQNHHLDMELKRLYGVIDAMARVNPRQIQYIKEVQPDFDFQERKIQPSLNVATSDDLFKVDVSEDENDSTKSKGSRQSHLSRSLSIGTPSLKSAPFNARSTLHKPADEQQQQQTPAPVHPSSPSHRLSASIGSAGTSGARLTVAISSQNHPNSSVPPTPGAGTGLSNEDRRLLTRAKWLLKRLLDSDDDPLLMAHPFDPDAALGLTTNLGRDSDSTSITKTNLDGTDGDPMDSTSTSSDMKWKIENKKKKAEKKYYFIENILKDILNDEVKKRETLFVLNILSFLKDGNSKCLSEADSRSWAQELLQSVGRNTSLISTIMGSTSGKSIGQKDSNELSGRRSSLTDPEIDMDTWRSVLVHMRANYPIGLAGKSAHVKYIDETDPVQVKLMTRIETMKADLIDIVQIKEEKIHNSKSGKILESTMTLKEALEDTESGGRDGGHRKVGPSSGMVGTSATLPSSVNGSSHEMNSTPINLYAENILNQPGKRRGGGGGGAIIEEEEEEEEEEEDEDEDLKRYDDIVLTRDPFSGQQQSQILSLQQSLVDTLSTSTAGGKTVEFDDTFIINQAKKEEEDRERDRARLRERRKILPPQGGS